MARQTSARVYRTPDGTCIGEIGIPRDDDDDDVVVRAEGPDGAAALMHAANLADTLLQDPLLAAVIPPQATMAIAATRHLAEAASAGGGLLRSLWRSIKGPGKRRLAKAIMRTTPRVSLIGAVTTRDHRKPRRRTVTARPPAQPQNPYGGGYDPYGGYGGYGGYPPPYPQGGGYGGYPPPYQGYPPQGYYPPQGQGYDPMAYGQYGYNPYLTPFAGGYQAPPAYGDPWLSQDFVEQQFAQYGF